MLNVQHVFFIFPTLARTEDTQTVVEGNHDHVLVDEEVGSVQFLTAVTGWEQPTVEPHHYGLAITKDRERMLVK